MVNESITDDIVSDFFRNDELYKQKQVIIERQGSTYVKINKLLENASKSGNKQGRPDFIIQYIENHNLIIVIESKVEKNIINLNLLISIVNMQWMEFCYMLLFYQKNMMF